MSLIVLDTDVASALLKRRSPEGLARRAAGGVPAITFVTLGELKKCLVDELPLVTFNQKDFVDFEQHEGLRLLH